MHSHVSFEPVSDRNGAWFLAVIWDHVFRERIPNLEFASEDHALAWISEHSDDWLAGRPYGGTTREGPESCATSSEGDQLTPVTCTAQTAQAGTIGSTGLKGDDALGAPVAAEASPDIKTEASESPRDLSKPFDVTPERIKQMSGIRIVYRDHCARDARGVLNQGEQAVREVRRQGTPKSAKPGLRS